jgi:hypothetical protein
LAQSFCHRLNGEPSDEQTNSPPSFRRRPWEDEKKDSFLHNVLARQYNVQIVDTPDVLIFTQYGTRNRLYSCKKIFYTQERYFPDWKQCDAAVASAFCDDPRAYYYPFFAAHRKGEDLVRPANFDSQRILNEPRGFCSFLHKHANHSVRPRTKLFHELKRRKKVDSGGLAVNNTSYEMLGTAGRAKNESRGIMKGEAPA